MSTANNDETKTTNAATGTEAEGETRRDFVRDIVRADLESGKHQGVVTRFPPEPNGYLHIGHAKAICLNFGIAEEFGGRCHLRFDDTNPTTEDVEYTEAIERDIAWLGFDWGEHLYFASDYFAQMADYAVHLIRQGMAYVDSSNEAEIRELRGTINEPGRPSPDRDRSIEENLELFERMKAGELPDGSHVLRAKIDLAANNMLMRDPLLYRIRHAHHYRTGDAWCIYPMYDFAHCLEDAIEHVTHSVCTLEFENNRELYDWVIDHTPVPSRPRQYEFARLNLSYTVMSKRKLLQLVNEGHVEGWDDPRMPTLSGMRRRGYTPEAIRQFCDRVGVAKTYNVIDVALLEHSLRDDLNQKVPRVMAVLDPLEVVITNYPEGTSETFDAPFYPHDVPKEGSRPVPFSRTLHIEREDFEEDPPEGYYRLAPGREVRLRYAYLVTCTGVEKNDAGEVVRVLCTYDPATRGGNAPDGRRVPGTLHWVSAEHSIVAEVRLYDRLFDAELPGADDTDFLDQLNPDSLRRLEGARLEPSLASAAPGDRFQFERQGYFVADRDSTAETLVFNRTVTLRDTWAKLSGQAEVEERRHAAERKAAEKAALKERQRLEAQSAGEPERELDTHQEERATRYHDQHGLGEADARLLASDDAVADFFEAALATYAEPRPVANWVLNELLRELKDRTVGDLPFGPAELAGLVALQDGGEISGNAAKQVFEAMLAGEAGGDPEAIVDARGLRVLDDTAAIAATIAEVLAANPGQVAAYRGGKTALLGFFIGQVMKATGGRAKAQQVRELLLEALGG